MELDQIFRRIEKLCCGLPSQTEWLFVTSEISITTGSNYGEIYITDHPDIQTDFIKFCASRPISTEEDDVKKLVPTEEKKWTENNVEDQQTDCSSDNNDDGISLPETENNQKSKLKPEEIDQKQDLSPEWKPDSLPENRCNNFSTEIKPSKTVRKKRKKRKLKLSNRKGKPKRTVKKEKYNGEIHISSEEHTVPKGDASTGNLCGDTSEHDKVESKDVDVAGHKAHSSSEVERDNDEERHKVNSPCKRTLKRWLQGGKPASPAQQLAAKNRPCKMKEPLVDEDGNQYYECDVCGMRFHSSKETIRHHKKDHVSNRSFPCKECDKVYHTKTPWLHHIANIHCNNFGNELFTCERCLASFPYVASLKNHQKRCNAGPAIDIITCNLCEETFVHYALLQNHVELMHSGIDAKIKCRHCDLWFKSEEEMTKHAEVHQSSSYQCQICKKCFSSNDDLIQHGNCIKKIKSLSLECTFCGRNFVKLPMYKRHMLLHVKTNLKKKFECELCQKECASAESYKRHQLSHLPEAEKPHRCEECGHGCSTRALLKLHMKNHRENKNDYMCDTCGAAFRVNKQLINHIRRKHTGEKPFSCDMCQQSFHCADSLKNHKDRNHTSNIHVCEICGQNYKTKRSLTRHLWGHRQMSERKKTKCDKCSQVLSSHQHYLIHYGRTHLTVEEMGSFPLKTYKCEVCDKICMCKWKLKVHMRIHTGEKPNKCRHCGKGFAERCNMLVHERAHTNTERYGCYCGKMYSNPRGLRIHQKNCSAAQEESEMSRSLSDSIDSSTKEQAIDVMDVQDPGTEQGSPSNTVTAVFPQAGNMEGIIINYSTIPQNSGHWVNSTMQTL